MMDLVNSFSVVLLCSLGAEDVFTVLFEYCRVSEVALQRILESLIPNRLIESFPDLRRCVVGSLAQVVNCCLE